MSQRRYLDIKPYGHIGPYGETLWDLLSSFKAQFIRGCMKKLPDDAIAPLIEDILLCIREERTYLQEKRFTVENHSNNFSFQEALAHFTDELLETANTEHSKARELSQQRLEQIQNFLADCEQIAQSTELEERDKVEHLLAKTLSAYYFIRPFPDVKDDIWITWLPNYNFMREMRQRDVELKEEDESPDLLTVYPSIASILTQQESQPLASLLKHSLSIGEMDVNRPGLIDIGHVQPFIPEKLVSGLSEDLHATAHPRSRWSDLFYYNRSALRLVDGQYHLNADHQKPLGMLFLTSCLQNLLRKLEVYLPSSEETASSLKPVKSLLTLAEKSWYRCRGDIKSQSLRIRFNDTIDTLLEESLDKQITKEQHDSLLFSFGHHIGGIFQESGIALLKNKFVISRLRLAWGFADATRLIKYKGKGLPPEWLQRKNHNEAWKDESLITALQDICRFYLLGHLEGIQQDWILEWFQAGNSQRESIHQLLNQHDNIQLPALPPLSDNRHRRPGTQAICIGLAELIRNAVNSIRSGLTERHIDEPVLKIHFILDPEQEGIKVTLFNLCDTEKEGEKFSRSIERIQKFEQQIMTIDGEAFVKTEQPFFGPPIKNLEAHLSGTYKYCQATWQYRYGKIRPQHPLDQ